MRKRVAPGLSSKLPADPLLRPALGELLGVGHPTGLFTQGLCESAMVPLPLVCQAPGARQEIEIGEMPLARPGAGAWGRQGLPARRRE